MVLLLAELVLGHLTLNRIPTTLLRHPEEEAVVSRCWYVEKVESWSAHWRRQTVNLGRQRIWACRTEKGVSREAMVQEPGALVILCNSAA